MFLLNEKAIKDLNSLKKYEEFLKQFPIIKNPNSRNIKIGNLYSCDNYDFSTDYPEEILKYFDHKPLQLVFNSTSTHFWALNLHFISVLTRANILKKIQNLNPVIFKNNNKFNLKKINITYNTLLSIFRKAKHCVRCYRYDRIDNIRMIDYDKWIESSQYSPDTFNSVNIEQIIDKLKIS